MRCLEFLNFFYSQFNGVKNVNGGCFTFFIKPLQHASIIHWCFFTPVIIRLNYFQRFLSKVANQPLWPDDGFSAYSIKGICFIFTNQLSLTAPSSFSILAQQKSNKSKFVMALSFRPQMSSSPLAGSSESES